MDNLILGLRKYTLLITSNIHTHKLTISNHCRDIYYSPKIRKKKPLAAKILDIHIVPVTHT